MEPEETQAHLLHLQTIRADQDITIQRLDAILKRLERGDNEC